MVKNMDEKEEVKTRVEKCVTRTFTRTTATFGTIKKDESGTPNIVTLETRQFDSIKDAEKYAKKNRIMVIDSKEESFRAAVPVDVFMNAATIVSL